MINDLNKLLLSMVLFGISIGSYCQTITPMDEGGGTAPATPTSTITVSTNTCDDKTLTRSGTPPSGTVWLWQTSPNGGDLQYNGTTYVVSQEGTRTIYLRAYKPANGMWSTGYVSKSVTVNTVPSAPTGISVENQCGQTVLTRGTPPTTPPTTWYWQGTSSTAKNTTNSNQTLTVTAGGTYYINAVTGAGCWSTNTGTTVTVTQATVPSVTIARQQTTICPGQAVTFNVTGNSNPITSYAWKINGVTKSTNTSFTTTELTNNDLVILAATVSGCVTTNAVNSNTISNSVPALIPVSVTINNPGPQCSFTGTTFTATVTNGGSAPIYTWYRNNAVATDNEITGNTNSYRPHYALQNNDKIKCVLTSNANGCLSNNPATSNEVTITMVGSQTPTITIVPDRTTICNGETVVFTASTSHTLNGSITWSLGGTPQGTGNSFSISNFQSTPANNLTASATVMGECLTTTSVSSTYTAANISVNPVPVLTATGQTICSGTQTSLAVASSVSGTSISWTVSPSAQTTGGLAGSGTTPMTIAQTLNNTSQADGTVTYIITPSKNGCVGSTISPVITVKSVVIPIVTIVPSLSSICPGESVVFIATSPQTITNYSWSLNGGPELTSNDTYSTSSLSEGDVVHVTVGISSTCQTAPTATANTSQNFQVKADPIVTVSPQGSSKVCSDCSQTITGYQNVNYTYSWIKDGIVIAGASGSTYSTAQAGAYSFQATTLQGCTKSSSIVQVLVNALPIVNVDNERIINLPTNSLTLQGTASDPDGTIVSYVWTKRTGPTCTMTDASTANLAISNAVKGTYTFRLTVTDNFGESAWRDVNVEVREIQNNYNWITETIVNVEGQTSDTQLNGLNIGDKNINWQYFDGLGRPMQTVSVQSSPKKFDVTQPVVYDEYGREIIKYLPYVSAGQNGHFKDNFIAKENPNYSSPLLSPHYGFYQTAGALASDESPYAHTIYERSPLNRVVKQGAPGQQWQPDATNTFASSDRTIKWSYETNSATEVLKWTYSYPSASSPDGDIQSGAGGSPNYYEANELFKIRTKDENGNETIEYKDKMGRVILKRVQAVAGQQTLNDTNYASTYYIYDDFGNLVVVLPPEAVKAFGN